MKREELLSYAIENYPLGTIFKSAYSEKIFTVENNLYTLKSDDTITIDGKYLYDNKQWAEIIALPKDYKISSYLVNNYLIY